MIPLRLFAGFGPKDLMGILYIPAIGFLIITSVLILILKKRGRHYILATLVFLPASFIWYLYDKIALRKVDRNHERIVIGYMAVFGIYALASSPLIRNTSAAVNAMAGLATLTAVVVAVISVNKRNN
ncbi:MAG: hypothetical protein M3Q79_01755 [bacterium]|nr:hypothetical protein [bacterium]